MFRLLIFRLFFGDENKATHLIRNRRAKPSLSLLGMALLLSLCVFFLCISLSACDKATVERRYNAQGRLVEEQAWLEIHDARGQVTDKVPHGLHVNWDSAGQRRRLEVFNRGKRMGYVLSWDEAGYLHREGAPMSSSPSLAQNAVSGSEIPSPH